MERGRAISDRAYKSRSLRRTSMESGRNLLGQETSPYLLQHAHNPVHWRPWSADALAEAKRRDCPILLSIGYAACHWCHVMAHEVVRERRDGASHERAVRQHQSRPRGAPGHRPHLHDARSMRSASRAAGRSPCSLSPDGKPMIGGTYWPPEPRYGRPVVPAGSPIDRFRVAHAARSDGEPRPHPRRPSGEALRVERRPRRLARRPHPRRRCAAEAPSIPSMAA